MLRSPLLAIFLIVVVDVLALTLIIPLLPFYAEHFGASPWMVGLLTASFAACQLVAGPVLGNLSDRHGRKPVLLISQLGTLVGFVMLAEARSLAMLFFSRMIDGITAGNLTVAQAVIADVTPPEGRARAFALIGIAFGLGFLVGPAASGALTHYGHTAPIWCAAGLSALSIVCTLTLLPHAPRAPTVVGERRLGVLDWSAYGALLRRSSLAPRFMQFLLFSLSFVLFTSGLALYAERRFTRADGAPFGPREVGYLFAYAGLLGLVLQGGVVSRVITRFGEARAVTVGFVLQAIGFAFLSLAHSLAGLALAATVASCGHAPLRPALTSLVSRNAHADEQGLALGFTQSLSSMAQVISPLVAGALIGHGSLDAWAYTAACVSLLGALLTLR
jgi:MFS family permease